MNYLGGLRGAGLLTCADTPVARTEYDFDGYLSKTGEVTSCGEIRLPVAVLKDVFGHVDLQLRTDDGRLLRLRFSEKRLLSDNGAAHVDVVGELPALADWRLQSGRSEPRVGPSATSRRRKGIVSTPRPDHLPLDAVRAMPPAPIRT